MMKMKSLSLVRASLLLSVSLVVCASVMHPSMARADDAPASQPAKTEPVDYKKLKETLPEQLGDLKRNKIEGQKMKIGEQAISTAEGTYGDPDAENAPNAELTYLDYGTTDIAAGIGAMLNMDIDNESDTEWTKSVKIDDQKAIMTYNKQDKHGSVQTAAGGRILVTLEARNLTEEQFKKAADALPLKKLAELVK
jgi:hypothetical protein